MVGAFDVLLLHTARMLEDSNSFFHMVRHIAVVDRLRAFFGFDAVIIQRKIRD